MSAEKSYQIVRTPQEVFDLTGIHLLNTWSAMYSETRDGKRILYLPKKNEHEEILGPLCLCSFHSVVVDTAKLSSFLQLIDSTLSPEERVVIQRVLPYVESSSLTEIEIPISFTTAMSLLARRDEAEQFFSTHTLQYWAKVATYCQHESDLWVQIFRDDVDQLQLMLLNRLLALESAVVKDEQLTLAHEDRHAGQAELLRELDISIGEAYEVIRKSARAFFVGKDQVNHPITKAEFWFKKLLKLEYELSALKECDAIMSEIQSSSDQSIISTILAFIARTYRIHYQGFAFDKTLLPRSEIVEFMDMMLGVKDIDRPAKPTSHFLGMLIILFGPKIFSEELKINFDITHILAEPEGESKKEELMRVIFQMVHSTQVDPAIVIRRAHDSAFREQIVERMIKAGRLLVEELAKAKEEVPELFTESDIRSNH